MADSTGPGRNDSAENNAKKSPERVLLLIIASDPTVMDDLLTALLDFGVTGATVVESKGLAAVLREEMPIFAGLVSLLPGATGSRTLLSITDHATARNVLNFIDSDLREDKRPIAAVLPVTHIAGLKR